MVRAPNFPFFLTDFWFQSGFANPFSESFGSCVCVLPCAKLHPMCVLLLLAAACYCVLLRAAAAAAAAAAVC